MAPAASKETLFRSPDAAFTWCDPASLKNLVPTRWSFLSTGRSSTFTAWFRSLLSYLGYVRYYHLRLIIPRNVDETSVPREGNREEEISKGVTRDLNLLCFSFRPFRCCFLSGRDTTVCYNASGSTVVNYLRRCASF